MSQPWAWVRFLIYLVILHLLYLWNPEIALFAVASDLWWHREALSQWAERTSR